MNTDTGKSYIGRGDVDAALSRGERLREITYRAAETIRAARQALARQKWNRRRKKARRRDAMAKASRKVNR
jgi:topoisomerase IA-like protein